MSSNRAYFAIRSIKKNYHFKAKNESDRHEWFLALQEVGCQVAVARPSSVIATDNSVTENSEAVTEKTEIKKIEKNLYSEMTKSQEKLIVTEFTENGPPEPPPFEYTEGRRIEESPPGKYP